MADEEKKEEGHPMQIVLFVVAILGALIVLWYYNGGPSRADLRGIFLAPPAPIGTGDAYGPQLPDPNAQ